MPTIGTMSRGEKHQSFPGIGGAMLLLLSLFGIQILCYAFAYEAGFYTEGGDPALGGVVMVLSAGVLVSALMKLKNLDYRGLFHPSPCSVQSIFVLLTVPIVLFAAGAVFWLTDLTSAFLVVFPAPEAQRGLVERMVSGGFASVVTVCLIAPFVEEILFRGFFLRSFLHRYGAIRAVLLSAALFALYHLTLVQLPAAFVVGLFSGWLYVRIRSLWPCILFHAVYNATVMIYWYKSKAGADIPVESDTSFHSTSTILAAMLISAAGLYLLAKLLHATTGNAPAEPS